MASQVHHDGNTVTVTTDEGHRIGFAAGELNAPSTSGEITTDWAGGVPPANPETTVRAAKADAEAHVAQHGAPSAPDEAQQGQERKGLGGAIKDALGMP